MVEAEINAFWLAFCQRSGLVQEMPGTTVFGDMPEMQNELCELVLCGTKRATASLAIWYQAEGKPIPKPGDLSIVLDGFGAPRCVIETTQVLLGPFRSADAAFAADEGERDGSLGHWVAEHRRYFTSELAKEGKTFEDSLIVVFERFKLR